MCIVLGAAHICISFLIVSLLLSPLSIATRYILFDLDSDISSSSSTTSTTLPPSSSLPETPKLDRFREAPAFRNGKECIISPYAHNHNHDDDDDDGNEGSDHHHHNSSMIQSQDLCDITSIHIAMTLDVNYLRGSVAAIFSIVKHSACPENLAFHFLSTGSEESLASIITSTFPYLRFRIYRFDEALVKDKISSSIREALEQPLNYARTYIADMLPHCIKRVIYLDSDLIVVDDIVKLWGISLGSHPLGAPEYCQANFTQYFRDAFWANYANEVFNGSDNSPNPSIVVNTMNSDNAADTKNKKKKKKKEIMMMRMRRNVMKGKRRPCYFNTGVMVMDLEMWRSHGFSREIERWMKVQQEERIYELGSLPPFLLVFGGNVKEVDHRWNQHGLGGDNIEGRCRPLHPGPVSLLHWSGKGKPWMRLDAQTPCPLDSLWAPYDLLSHHHHHHHHLPHHMSSIIAS